MMPFRVMDIAARTAVDFAANSPLGTLDGLSDESRKVLVRAWPRILEELADRLARMMIECGRPLPRVSDAVAGMDQETRARYDKRCGRKTPGA